MSKKNDPQQDATILSSKQETALAALLSGATAAVAAKAAGVHRSTMYRWLGNDYNFQAAYNRGRLTIRDELDNRMMRLAFKDVETVEAALKDGNIQAALSIIKIAGGKPKIGETDPKELMEIANAELTQKAISSFNS